MRGDGKNKFYRNLNLPKDAKKWIDWLRKNMDKIKGGAVVPIPERRENNGNQSN